MLTEGTCWDVRRLYRSRQCIYAIWWTLPAHRDTVNGCKASCIKGQMRYSNNDGLRLRPISFIMEPIPWIYICSAWVYLKNRCSRRRLQQNPYDISGVLPQNERGSKALEPAVCSTPRSIWCSDWLRTSFNRWKGFHVRYLQWYWCTAYTRIICSGCGKGKGYHHTWAQEGGQPACSIYNR